MKTDLRLRHSLKARTASQIYNRIRGLGPWPGAFTTFRGRLCHVWGRPPAPQHSEPPGALLLSGDEVYVACGEGTRLRLEAAQLAGRKRGSARDFANGARLQPGEQYGS